MRTPLTPKRQRMLTLGASHDPDMISDDDVLHASSMCCQYVLAPPAHRDPVDSAMSDAGSPCNAGLI